MLKILLNVSHKLLFYRNELVKYWRLSAHENLSRMRLKLEAQADSQPASLAAAVRLRDNLERAPQPTKLVAPPRAPRAHHDILADEELKLSLEPEYVHTLNIHLYRLYEFILISE